MAYFYIVSKFIALIKSMRFYKIPASSLLPTIMAGDWIVTLKVWSKKNIKRRDLIVFPYPPEPSINYIKRVIGLPGEKLEIKKDLVFINGEPLNEPYAYFEPDEKYTRQDQDLTDLQPVSRYGPVVVPEGKLFVMGDNRYNSADSRYWGFVDSDTVGSKAWFIYWSIKPENNSFMGINFHRIFKKIE